MHLIMRAAQDVTLLNHAAAKTRTPISIATALVQSRLRYGGTNGQHY